MGSIALSLLFQPVFDPVPDYWISGNGWVVELPAGEWLPLFYAVIGLCSEYHFKVFSEGTAGRRIK